jgi:hypothetical protein
MKKTDKPVYYTAMTILVEMEVRANSQADADAILRHKMQTLCATNPDLAVNEMVSRKSGLGHLSGFDLKALP